MSDADTERPHLARFLWGGAVAGCAGAILNSLYFMAQRTALGFEGAEPSLGSVVLSSLFPPLLAALGYGLLSRFTTRATPVFVGLTCAITLMTFHSMRSTTLPDGRLKPAGFDAVVMPMHVVVGGLAALCIPSIARRQRRRGSAP